MKLVARVSGATNNCEFSSDPSIPGLPVSVPCSNGKVKTTVTVPASVATVEETYKFELTMPGTAGASSPFVNVRVAPGGVALSGISSVASDDLGTSCAVLSDGGVDCWGYNEYGLVGNGTVDGPDKGRNYDTPQPVSGLTDAISVTSANYLLTSFCALLSTGGVACWGTDSGGQLGNGTTGGPDGRYGYDTPQMITGLTDAVSLTGGENGSYCAVLSTGGVDCWGYNDDGELGDGTTGGPDGQDGYDTPQTVTGITHAVSITADAPIEGTDGSDSYCAVLSNGTANCWGHNLYEELGNGTIGGPDGRGFDTPTVVTSG